VFLCSCGLDGFATFLSSWLCEALFTCFLTSWLCWYSPQNHHRGLHPNKDHNINSCWCVPPATAPPTTTTATTTTATTTTKNYFTSTTKTATKKISTGRETALVKVRFFF
jgi:hypothetical protein